MGERLRLMAVHAHPDDESSKGGATMAKYASQGMDVLVVTCTGGERGDVLNASLDRSAILGRLPALRRREMERARAILGVQHSWLGFVDSGLPEGGASSLPEDCFAREDVVVAAARLVRLIRRFRPHVVITYDEGGGYPHPDHIMTHRISVLAFDAAGDAERYVRAGDPRQPLKLYYHVASRGQILAEHEGMLAAGLPSPHGERLLAHRRNDHRITTRVECGDFFDVRDEALRAHVTQIEPDGVWFAVPLVVRRRMWPTEDYELVRSFVDSPVPEDDLFAGVHVLVGATSSQ
jgi:mycothiol S-conjugate amidase